MTDFDRDLADIDARLEVLGTAGPGDRDTESVTRVAHLHVRRASLSGRPADHERAEQEVASALAAVGPWPDLCLLRADLLSRVHEVAEAARSVEQVPGLAGATQGRAVLADVALQLGRYAEAEDLARGLVAQERTWDHLVRLAHLAACRGELDRADALYVEAEDEITAKSMRAYSWVELERGRWALVAGDHARARAHAETAARAYTGSWRVRQARAELFAAEGMLDRAVDEQEAVLAETGRPESHQALADLHARAGRPERSRAHRDAAMGTFLASAGRGEARYLHHLVELCAGGPTDTGEREQAVGWARRDVQLRPNHLTRGALAWALHSAGHQDEAVVEARQALATGMRDPRLLARLAEVLGTRDESAWPTPEAVGASS